MAEHTKITCPTCKGDLATCGHGAQPWSIADVSAAHRSLIETGYILDEPALAPYEFNRSSEAKCEECGAYYPHHMTRNCQGEHVEPVK